MKNLFNHELIIGHELAYTYALTIMSDYAFRGKIENVSKEVAYNCDDNNREFFKCNVCHRYTFTCSPITWKFIKMDMKRILRHLKLTNDKDVDFIVCDGKRIAL